MLKIKRTKKSSLRTSLTADKAKAVTAGLRVKWIQWGCLPHICFCQDLEVHWETPTAFSSSFPPFPFVPIPQVPTESCNKHQLETQLLKLPRDRSLCLFYIDTTFSKLCDLIVPSHSFLYLSFPPHLVNPPSLNHHLPQMHTSPQLGFLPTCPRDHKGALHCGPTSACTLVKKKGNAGASRGSTSGITLLCGLS